MQSFWGAGIKSSQHITTLVLRAYLQEIDVRLSNFCFLDADCLVMGDSHGDSLCSVGKYSVFISEDNIMHLSIFSPRGGGGRCGRDTLGIRQQNNPNPQELDRTPRHMGGEIRYIF